MKSNLKKTIKKELSLLTEQSQQIPMEVEVIECGTMGPPQTLHINLWGQYQGATGNPVPPNQADVICDGALQPGGSYWSGDPNHCMGPIFEISQVLGPSTQSGVDFGLLSDPLNGVPFNGCAQITFDCNNPTQNCMYDPNVQGQYTNLQDCQQNCTSNWQPETWDCVGGTCVSAGFTGAGAYSDYVTCFNAGCGGPEPGAIFTASICKCTMDPVLQIPCPPLSTTRNVTVPYTIDYLTPNQGDAFSSHCISGRIGVDSWMCTWEVTSISGYGEPQIQRNRNSSTCDSDERGCMDKTAINYMQCCDTTDPNCVPNLSTDDCCKYDVEPTKHCTCCKKMKDGTVGGFSLNTAIPVGDSCSQFNNSQPGLYGCVDSTTWSLVKCKQPLPNDPVDFNLAEEIKRYKQLL